MIAFTGVRGAVSLAAALALPFTLPGGDAFPYRDLILFVAFGVILITLVGLGLTLPLVVRWLGIARGRPRRNISPSMRPRSRRGARRWTHALNSLDAMTDDRELSDEVVKLLRARHEVRASQLPDSLDPDQHDVIGRRHRVDPRTDRGRAQVHPRAAARRPDHRRERAAASSATSIWKRPVWRTGSIGAPL